MLTVANNTSGIRSAYQSVSTQTLYGKISHKQSGVKVSTAFTVPKRTVFCLDFSCHACSHFCNFCVVSAVSWHD